MSFLTPLSIHRAHESSPNARALVARLPDGLADDEGVQSEAAKIAFPIVGATTVVAASLRHDRRFRAWGKLDLDFGYIANAEQRVGVEIRILRLAFHELRSLVQVHAQSPQRCLQKADDFLAIPQAAKKRINVATSGNPPHSADPPYTVHVFTPFESWGCCQERDSF